MRPERVLGAGQHPWHSMLKLHMLIILKCFNRMVFGTVCEIVIKTFGFFQNLEDKCMNALDTNRKAAFIDAGTKIIPAFVPKFFPVLGFNFFPVFLTTGWGRKCIQKSQSYLPF